MDIQTAANQIAATKIQADADARKTLTPGTYKVDTTLRITGTINVGQDSEVTPTTSIPLKETLALFYAYCGVTGAAAEAALLRAMQTAISQDGKGKGELAATLPVVNQMMARVESGLATLPKVKRNGPVTHRLTVTTVGQTVNAD